MPHLESGAATHVGRRSNNEDSFLLRPELGLFAVADGLGGHEGGEVASQLVVSTVADFLAPRLLQPPSQPVEEDSEALLLQAQRRAHDEVRSQQKGKLSTMASTLTALLLREGEAQVCNLGDSRIFLVREGALQRLTRDHTVLAEMEEAGIDTKSPFAQRHRNSLTGAVGMEAGVDPDAHQVPMRAGDVFLLCSDGLYEPVPPDLMLEVVGQGGSAQQLAERLVTLAYERGGTDNITGVVVRVLDLG